MKPQKFALLAACAVPLLASLSLLEAAKYEDPNTVPLVNSGVGGNFAPASGTVTINTHDSPPTMDTNCDGSNPGFGSCAGVVVSGKAVFNFDGVSIPSGVTVTTEPNSNSRSLVILSRSDMNIPGGTIQVNGGLTSVAAGGGGAANGGGFNNGSNSAGTFGDGGGMQGSGGGASAGQGLDNPCFDDVSPAVAGIATGGSGGKGTDPNFTAPAPSGGGGGGGLELGALGTFTCGNCVITGPGGVGEAGGNYDSFGDGGEGAGGGAGGGLIVHANIITSSGGTYDFSGGAGGEGGDGAPGDPGDPPNTDPIIGGNGGAGGGGGGGGRILFAYATSSGIPSSGSDSCGDICDNTGGVNIGPGAGGAAGFGGYLASDGASGQAGGAGSCRVKQDVTVPIPEPSEYAFMFGVATILFVAFRRRFSK